MENVLVVIFRLLLGFLAEITVFNFLEWPSLYRTAQEPKNIGFACFLWFCGGCIIAAASLLIFDHALITTHVLRIVNLIFAPITTAYIFRAIARQRSVTNPLIIPDNHFWGAFFSMLGFVLFRFAYAPYP
jgi:hypothetical protein